MQEINDLQIVREALDIIKPLAQKLEPEKYAKIESDWVEKTSSTQPKIMIYGMYSNGKSTLINALIGKEVAKVGRMPTTDQIDEYQWEAAKCTLLDSPGIEAMAEHTSIATDKRDRCELVAFVVESGSIEADILWKEILKIVQRDQKVCLIINDFDDIRFDPEKIGTLKDRLRTNLQNMATKLGYQGDILEKVPMTVVNAKLAFKGKIEKNNKLVEYSSIPAVENMLTNLAKAIDRKDIFNTMRKNILKLALDCRLKLNLENGNKALNDAETVYSDLVLSKETAYKNIESNTEMLIGNLGSQLASIFESGNQQTIENDINRIVADLAKDVTEYATRELSSLSKEINTFVVDFKNINVEIQHSDVLNYGENQATENSFLNSQLTSQGVEQVYKDLNLAPIVETAITKSLMGLKSLLPELFKGIGLKTFGKWASAISNAIGPIVSIGVSIFECYNSYKAEQEAENRARRKAQAIMDAVNSTKEKLRQLFKNQLDDLFSENIDPIVEKVKTQLEDLRKNYQFSKEQEEILGHVEAILKI